MYENLPVMNEDKFIRFLDTPHSQNSSSNVPQEKFKTAVKVCVRVRPLLSKELLEGDKSAISVLDNQSICLLPNQKTFHFDNAYSPDISQSTLYSQCVLPLVPKFLSGINTTILAYGPTGTGKSYTVGLTNESQGYTQSGIAPRILSSVFHLIKPFPNIQVHLSFIELLNDDIIDLLDGNNGAASYTNSYSSSHCHKSGGYKKVTENNTGEDNRRKLNHSWGKGSNEKTQNTITIREDMKGNVIVVGAKTEQAHSFTHALRILQKGSNTRTSAATKANDCSSRSHAIFTLSLSNLRQEYVTQIEKYIQDTAFLSPLSPIDSQVFQTHFQQDHSSDHTPTHHSSLSHPPFFSQVESETISILNSSLHATSTTQGLGERFATVKLHIVDLAGAERVRRSGAHGNRLKEATYINSGLLALGNVISALSPPSGVTVPSHIPYRSSRLTRLLQDSLGGSSQTLMVACVSPSQTVIEETSATLAYAGRARHIKNSLVRRRLSLEGATIASLQEQVATLKMALLSSHQQLGASVDGGDGSLLSLSLSLSGSPSPSPSSALAQVASGGHANELQERMTVLEETLQKTYRELCKTTPALFDAVKKATEEGATDAVQPLLEAGNCLEILMANVREKLDKGVYGGRDTARDDFAFAVGVSSRPSSPKVMRAHQEVKSNRGKLDMPSSQSSPLYHSLSPSLPSIIKKRETPLPPEPVMVTLAEARALRRRAANTGTPTVNSVLETGKSTANDFRVSANGATALASVGEGEKCASSPIGGKPHSAKRFVLPSRIQKTGTDMDGPTNRETGSRETGSSVGRRASKLAMYLASRRETNSSQGRGDGDDLILERSCELDANSSQRSIAPIASCNFLAKSKNLSDFIPSNQKNLKTESNSDLHQKLSMFADMLGIKKKSISPSSPSRSPPPSSPSPYPPY